MNSLNEAVKKINENQRTNVFNYVEEEISTEISFEIIKTENVFIIVFNQVGSNKEYYLGTVKMNQSDKSCVVLDDVSTEFTVDDVVKQFVEKCLTL